MCTIGPVPAAGLAPQALPGAASSPSRPGVLRRWSALVASVLVAMLMVGCAGRGNADAAPGTGSLPGGSVEPSAPTTPTPAAPTDDGTADQDSTTDGSGGGASGGGGATFTGSGSAGSGGRTAGGGGSGNTGSAGGTGSLSAWPPEVSPVHGGRAWAVYLAVGSPESDWDMHMLGEMESYARGLGYVGAGIGSVGCDQGAAEALGLDPGDNRVAVYFDTAADAQLFEGLYDRQTWGSAQVTTYCLD